MYINIYIVGKLIGVKSMKCISLKLTDYVPHHLTTYSIVQFLAFFLFPTSPDGIQLQ